MPATRLVVDIHAKLLRQLQKISQQASMVILVHPGCGAVKTRAALLVNGMAVDARVRQQQLKQRPPTLDGGIRCVPGSL